MSITRRTHEPLVCTFAFLSPDRLLLMGPEGVLSQEEEEESAALLGPCRDLVSSTATSREEERAVVCYLTDSELGYVSESTSQEVSLNSSTTYPV